MPEANIVQSVDRALTILSILQETEEPLGVTAVSYTHLDVYKRQVRC